MVGCVVSNRKGRYVCVCACACAAGTCPQEHIHRLHDVDRMVKVVVGVPLPVQLRDGLRAHAYMRTAAGNHPNNDRNGNGVGNGNGTFEGEGGRLTVSLMLPAQCTHWRTCTKLNVVDSFTSKSATQPMFTNIHWMCGNRASTGTELRRGDCGRQSRFFFFRGGNRTTTLYRNLLNKKKGSVGYAPEALAHAGP